MVCRIGMKDRRSGWRYKTQKLFTEAEAERLAAMMRQKYPRFEYHVIPATKPWTREKSWWN